MDNISVLQLTTEHPDYNQVFDLREEVLRKPIGLSLRNEDLSADVLDTILTAWDNGTVIGCVMLKPLADTTAVQLRQMAVATGYQGKGIGKILVEASEDAMRQKGIHKIILHARTTAEGFYNTLGYTKTSGIFTEVGIPHVVMEKEL